ncbi:MAG TPA: hypothetical protein PKA13_03200 [Geminicoccaceae bacterium]|nr:hypothetical protein [Geminicoccus sp.]HMU48754.1 hypothetical protein [Geminicoccaceae bacterium]
MGRRLTPPAIVAGLLAAALAGCSDAASEAAPERVWPVFCYRTLADVACYAEIDPGRERRLTGIYAFVGEPWWIAYGSTPPPLAAGPLPLFPSAP